MSEAALQKKIINYLKTVDKLWFVNVPGNPQGRGRRGIPDILICYMGEFIAIEIKVGVKKPSKLQQYEIDKINNAQGEAFVARSLNDVIGFIELFDM